MRSLETELEVDVVFISRQTSFLTTLELFILGPPIKALHLRHAYGSKAQPGRVSFPDPHVLPHKGSGHETKPGTEQRNV